MAIIKVGYTTAPVPHIPQCLLDKITIVNLESVVDGKTTNELLLMTHCGTVMDVVQTTAAATRLGCCGSTGTSHRKWRTILRCVCVPIRAFQMKRSTCIAITSTPWCHVSICNHSTNVCSYSQETEAANISAVIRVLLAGFLNTQVEANIISQMRIPRCHNGALIVVLL